MLDLEGRAAMAMARRGPEVHPNPPTQRSNGRLGYQDGAPVSGPIAVPGPLGTAMHVRTTRPAARVRGHDVAWGLDAGGPYDRTTGREGKGTGRSSRGKGGPNTIGSPVTGRDFRLGADTAVSIERKVVSGHAYAIPAPEAVTRRRCGHDTPTSLSVDGVFDPQTQGPGASAPGPSSWR